MLAVGATAASAAWRLPSVISDNMVMQSDRPVALWGWSDPGDKVTVVFGKQTKTATADAKGKWMVQLDPLQASAEPRELKISGAASKSLISNVLVGEVWLASGQSNMAMGVNGCNRAAEEARGANLPSIRMFTAQRVTATEPQDDVKGSWVVCASNTVGGFSAAAFFFGRELHNTLKTPVGLIHSSWGGTPVEAWTSMDAQSGKPGFKPVMESWLSRTKTYDAAKDEETYAKALAAWEQQAKEAKAANKKPPRKPAMAGDPKRNSHYPASLFNGMIAPLIPYSLRGAIWYQGESNAKSATAPYYGEMLTTMIRDWRTRFNQGDFPFLYVQLANFNSGENWVVVQDEMRKALRFPNTGMAVINDVGDAGDIHPKNKQEVGRRLALWALAKTYGKEVEYSGPLFKSAEVKGSQMVVRFDHAAGLTAKGGEPLKGFTIAGAAESSTNGAAASGKAFVPAKAEIQGDAVIVSSPSVSRPAAVRYAWASNPDCNLYNKDGLPASVFRTDDWPVGK